MATMNLRRAVNSKENKGSGDRKAELLNPDLGDLEQISNSSLDLFKQIYAAESLSDQIAGIKALFQNLAAENHQIVAIVTVQWWFNSTLNSPVRKSVTGCLNQVKDENFKTLVVEQISLQLRKECTEPDSNRLQEIVKNIHRCLENFTCGEAGVEQEAEIIISYLQEVLQEKIEGICEEDVSPVDKVLFTDQAVEIIRVLVAVSKERIRRLDAEKNVSLTSFLERVVFHNSLPLDLRSNAGIIYVAGLGLKEIRSTLQNRPEDEESDGAMLSLAHGVLSCATTAELTNSSSDNGAKSFLQILLQLYVNLSKKVQGSNIVMGYSRGLLSWSGRFLEACKLEQVGGVEGVDTALEYSWSHLEHHIDSVRHNTKEYLNNLIQCCQHLGSEGEVLLNSFLQQTLALPMHKKARFSSLSCLVRAGCFQKILQLNPDFRPEILKMAEEEYALVGPITDLYDNIIKVDFSLKKDCIEDWYKGSISPLLNQFKESSSLGSSQLARNLLKKSGKLHPAIVELIFKEEKDLSGKLALYCLKLGRELGNPWNVVKHRDLVERSLKCSDEEERLQALALLVESHSSVERFEAVELNLLKEFIEVNLALPSAAGRQVFLANLKKMFTRIRDGALACMKKLSSERLKAEHPALRETLVNYSKFISSAVRTLFSNLFSGANFARRGTVLEILTQIHQTFNLTSPPSWLKLENVLTKTSIKSLYECLYDSFENNKEKALCILRDLPSQYLDLSNPDAVNKILDEILDLMSSSKPSSCLTAGYLMKLLLSAPAAAWVLADRLGLISAEAKKVKFYAAVYVRNTLAEQLHLAEANLLTAAAETPMYGALHVVRSIYSELTDAEVDTSWSELTKDLVSLGYSVWRVVAPVVASDSPEGHLPMDNDVEAVKQLQKTVERSLSSKESKSASRKSDKDFSLQCAVLDKVVVSDVFPDEIIEDILEDIIDHTTGHERPAEAKQDENDSVSMLNKSNISDEDVEEDGVDLSEAGIVKAKEVSSQMLLLCAWRSVKELSLFLGDLCDRDTSTSVPLLTAAQVLEVASFLMDLLAQTKHRGAFEQAYVAFTKLCECLWRSGKAELHTHPTRLLAELLENIAGSKKYSSSSRSGLCATRRSAGVPFIVQAIVSTEPDPSSPVFKDAMKKLIDLANDSSVEGEYRVHACNILRALFRDTRLGESVSGYVESGMKVSINGFEASNWAERNAATLLFSALMTRIFGVKREKDSSELSMKNCLTGKVFFQRYPSLHSFLLSKLEASSASSEAGTLQLHPALYPILLILSRIFPSPSESLNNPWKLSAFVPLVEKCSSSPILAIRKLAASALVPLIPPEQLASYGENLLSRLCTARLPTNLTHGLLLRLKQIKKSSPTLSLCRSELVESLVNQSACPLISAAYVGLVNMEKDVPQEAGDVLESVLFEKLYNGVEEDSRIETALSVPSDLWKPLFSKESTVFLSNWSLKNSDCSVMLKLFIHPEIEVRLKALHLYKEFLDAGKDGSIDKADILNLILCEKQDSCLSLLLQICCIFSSSSFQEADLSYFISLLQVKQAEDVLCSTVNLSGKIISALMDKLSEDPLVYQTRLEFAQTLKRFSSTEQSFQLRHSVAQILKENVKLLTTAPSKDLVDKQSSILLWSSLLDLIYDDEEEIRDLCVDINKQITGKDTSAALAGRSLVAQCFHHMGLVWPAAAVFTVLANIVTQILDSDLEVDTNGDRAFDKGEMNTYRELQTTCRCFLPQLSHFLSQLSPKLLDKTLKEQLPEQLIANLMPTLPGGVIVYSVNQLQEYFKAHDTWESSDGIIIRQMESALNPTRIVNPA